MISKLPDDIQYIKGVGPRWAKLLSKLGINTVEDLLYYFPRDYEDRKNICSIRYVEPGNKITVKGKIVNIEEQKPRKGLAILRITFSDDTDVINGVWFNQSYLKKQFTKGDSYYLYGEVNKKSWHKYNKKEISNPVFEKIEKNDDLIHTGRIVPIYALSSGITQKRLRKIIYNSLQKYAENIKDILPLDIRKKYSFLSIKDSLWGLHFPKGRENYINAHKRIAFEELFVMQLNIMKLRANIIKQKGIKHNPPGLILKKFQKALSFNLTSAQKRVWAEIKDDMEGINPMQRLLQGDVGSGKTIVAALALLETMANGYQGVFMAPTEILAEQHYMNLKELISPFDFKTVLLTGSMQEKERKETEEKIKNNEANLIIGTHALFQESINYHKIGLLIIDEQHRFGVNQRHKLVEKGDTPDMLVMTATPIPRSLALTLYGDLDLSIIDQLPPGRSKVITTWRKKKARPAIYKFVRDKLIEGRQVYVVCPLIEPSEEMELVSAEKMKENLQKKYLQDFNIGILHSKLKKENKQIIMNDFRNNRLQVLVSTTVIEVGVDIPNASIMIIEDAERFGLAQLHQLRGRVGRGKHQSYCILIANPKTEDGYKRLKVMTSTNDGFKIAEEDLEIRGPGEFFGTKQHGFPVFKIANILKDNKLLNVARKEAEEVLNKTDWENRYPDLSKKIAEMKIKI